MNILLLGLDMFSFYKRKVFKYVRDQVRFRIYEKDYDQSEFLQGG